MLFFVYVFGNALQLMSSSLKNVIFYEEDDDEGRYKNIETLFERHQDFQIMMTAFIFRHEI